LLMAASPLPGPAQPPDSGHAAPVGYLEAAALLGRRIADQAIWHENRCTWGGASLENGRGTERALTYATLGPDRYERHERRCALPRRAGRRHRRRTVPPDGDRRDRSRSGPGT